MAFTPCVVLAAALGCGLTGPAAEQAAVKAFVAYVAKNEIKLEADDMGWWAVTDPKADGYSVIVAFKTFPSGTGEADMRAALRTINLAFTLNAPWRLAMSHPGLRQTDLAKPVPKLDQVPVAATLFHDAPPPAAK